MKEIRFLCLILLSTLVLTACGNAAPAGDLPETPPETVVQDFYAWYLGERSAGPKDLHDSSAISAGLLARYDEARQSAQPGNMVSLVCAQDFPDNITVIDTQVNGERATVTVTSSFGNTIELTLLVADGTWQIDDVTCK
ncbi:MAG: DUF3828 domain-containing protein [Anaerolineales bacterium]|nr:DUF3828 domain-containing protein [Anaerolineales bacterium]